MTELGMGLLNVVGWAHGLLGLDGWMAGWLHGLADEDCRHLKTLSYFAISKGGLESRGHGKRNEWLILSL
jgi:hypothetical protein